VRGAPDIIGVDAALARALGSIAIGACSCDMRSATAGASVSDERLNLARDDASGAQPEGAYRSHAVNSVRESQQSGSRESASWIGRELDGRYRIVALLGEDDTGAVFLAQQMTLERWVGVKLVRAELVGSGDVVIRLAREAMRTLRLDHPHVHCAMDCGTLPEGGVYFVMQLARGISLRRLLENGAMPWARVCEIGAQIADALDAADAAGIVLRDLKPDNVLVEELEDGSDCVGVLDFGMAHIAPRQSLALHPSGVPRGTTTIATVMGTPGYMAPEQAIGGLVDHRTDLYALGVMLWEGIAGRPLWEGTEAAPVILRQLNESPPRLRDLSADPTLPPELERWVQRLLARDVALRPAHAAEVRDALRDIADKSLSAAPEPARHSLFSERRVLAAALGIWIALYLGARAWDASGTAGEPATPPAAHAAIEARTAVPLAVSSEPEAEPLSPGESGVARPALPPVSGLFVARRTERPPGEMQHPSRGVSRSTSTDSLPHAAAGEARPPSQRKTSSTLDASAGTRRADSPAERLDLTATRPALSAAQPGAPTVTAGPGAKIEPRPTEPKPATDVQVQVQALNVRGSVATSVVRRALERVRPQLRACHDTLHATVPATGAAAPELHVEVEFDERGYAREPRVAGRGWPALIECVTRSTSAIVLARVPDTGVAKASWTVTYGAEADPLR
jgi:serine/threonine protein kinase